MTDCKWIPITERYPASNVGNVLIYAPMCYGVDMAELSYTQDGKPYQWDADRARFQLYEVTHWMPLPEGPKS